MIRLNEYAASRAVSGVPSLHVSPGRILYVQVVLSADSSQDSARPGPGEKSAAEFSVSVGYMSWYIS